jgi:hypothetical protein
MEIEIIKVQSSNNTMQFACYLNNFLSNVKLLHWYTLNINLHEILGDTYSTLSDLFDKLQEEIIGVSNVEKVNVPFNQNNLNLFDESVLCNDETIAKNFIVMVSGFKGILTSQDFKNYTSSIKSGINNTAEEVISNLNKSLYLIEMIKL